MYVVTEYQYQLLRNYYPSCSVVMEIGRQPLKEDQSTQRDTVEDTTT